MARLTFFRRGGSLYMQGLLKSVHQNAAAFGYSVMITATYGMTTALQGSPTVSQVFLFAAGAVVGFVAVLVAATIATGDIGEPERAQMLVIVATLDLFSVLTAVGAAALVAWLGYGWYVWLTAPIAASAIYVLTSGL